MARTTSKLCASMFNSVSVIVLTGEDDAMSFAERVVEVEHGEMRDWGGDDG